MENTENESNKRQRSKIEEHKQTGKKLIPPLQGIPNMKSVSWRDERMPDMLWLVLLLNNLSKSELNTIIQKLGKFISLFHNDGDMFDGSITAIANADIDLSIGVLSIITKGGELREILHPLMVYDYFPGKEKWKFFVETANTTTGWDLIKNSVNQVLDHQSESSTYCRWVRAYLSMITGGINLGSKERYDEFMSFIEPNRSEKSGGMIRVTEMMLDMANDKKSNWSEKFWEESLIKSQCIQMIEKNVPAIEFTLPSGAVEDLYQKLSNHFRNNIISTAINAKLDTVFGIGFYTLGMLMETLGNNHRQSLTARLSLRTLAESYITLKYLSQKNNDDLWRSYRVFGSGQAKLISLKLDSEGSNQSFVENKTLNLLANEDIWEEFLDIDLGHWEKSNLRNLSIEAGVKEIYDDYYGWTSNFSHGHWGAIRDTVYVTCGNPLHRLHRIPRREIRVLPDIIPDACKIINLILDEISSIYPIFEERIIIKDNYNIHS